MAGVPGKNLVESEERGSWQPFLGLHLTDSKLEDGRICSEHFLSGKPAPLFDDTSPNWLPMEKLGHEKVSRNRVAACQEHYQRKRPRRERLNARKTVEGADVDVVEGAGDSVDISEGVYAVEGAGVDAVEGASVDAVGGAGDCVAVSEGVDPLGGASVDAVEDVGVDVSEGVDAVGGASVDAVSSDESQMKETVVQTDLTKENIMQLQEQLHAANTRILSLENKLAFFEPFTEAGFQNDKYVLFYTGLLNNYLLKTVFEFVAPNKSGGVLSEFQEFVATLIKLRLNPPLLDLTYRFKVSVSTMSRIFFVRSITWTIVCDHLYCGLIVKNFAVACQSVLGVHLGKRLPLLLIVLKYLLNDLLIFLPELARCRLTSTTILLSC